MNNDSKNLFMAIALSIVVLVGWQYFFGAPKLQKERADLQHEQSIPARPDAAGAPQPATTTHLRVPNRRSSGP